jgi:hypothetical protein
MLYLKSPILGFQPFKEGLSFIHEEIRHEDFMEFGHAGLGEGELGLDPSEDLAPGNTLGLRNPILLSLQKKFFIVFFDPGSENLIDGFPLARQPKRDLIAIERDRKRNRNGFALSIIRPDRRGPIFSEDLLDLPDGL